MNKYSVLIPTYRRPGNLRDQIEWVLGFEPSPEEILVTHVRNDKWTHKFDFEFILPKYDKVKSKFYESDPGLIGTKFTPAFEELDTDFVWTIDDDIFPGKRFINMLLESYQTIGSGIFGSMGFIYSENKFNKEVHGGWRGFPHDSYIHTDEITMVDSCGQSYFMNTTDFPKITPDDFSDWCLQCSDDLMLAYHAYQHDVNCYVPYDVAEDDYQPVLNLREGDIHNQSLVGGSHPDEQHKNELVQSIQNNDYVRVDSRE